ncbi:DUF4823 domain-containing protein [Oceanicoccus sp. KOV_DT_Chl]|uniref:DUF4823 domain-containing protein n=1 Tax=Oceanicoccus sp. KOV_DT_Chl TaxID=1904639 RepID=UPI000C79EC90|nr:DUF4823 domain-containing protein [Oceanicoccus sp. KOV_DT_Chl]
MKFKHLSVLLTVLSTMFLSACQPDFVKSETSQMAGSLGVINSFSISRWNTRRLEPSASFLIVSDKIDTVDAVALSNVVAQNMSPYFASVSGGYVKESLAAARTLAVNKGSHFLVYLEIVDSQSIVEDDQAQSDSAYNKLHLTMTLLDVVNGNTLDKITLTAKSSWVLLLGDDMQDLLAKPVTKIAQDLAGVAR